MRPIRPSDADAINALHSRLSAETIYFRFFSPLATLSTKMLNRFVQVDYVDRFALIALLGDDIIAVGRYERLPSLTALGDEGEVAFLVDDAHQGRGIATMLLEHLAARAKEVGITRFVADTLPENARMLRVFHEAGFGDHRTFADGVVRVVFPIEPTEASVAASHHREREAAARSVRRILAPRSVAVIGASRRPGSLGNELLRRLLQSHFNGPVYPVHPEATHINSVRAYPSILDVPDRVDLAVIAVPADAVPGAVEQCGRKHVGSLVVVSSGFAERDAAGVAAERQLVSEARRNGMRLIGPNCMGIVNTDPDVGLNATFSPMPPRGRIGLIAQSGALGVVILDEIARRGLGVSTFVSAGNKADVSGNDMLQYWDDDAATDVVLMYIETFGNPRTFGRVARRVSRTKPIVAVKSGRSDAGNRAGGWIHRTRQSDASVDALFRQTGVIRTETLEELFDVAQVLASQPLPAGPRVAIVGNNGGPGVLAADACIAAGLEMATLAPSTHRRLSACLPWTAEVDNPVDLAPDARPEAFGLAVEAALADDGVDAVIALYTSPVAAPIADVAAALAGAPGPATKPVLACVLGRRGLLEIPSADGSNRSIPSFAFPEAAARALGRVAEYSAWRARPVGTLPAFADIDRGAARAVVDEWARRPEATRAVVDEWAGRPEATRAVVDELARRPVAAGEKPAATTDSSPAAADRAASSPATPAASSPAPPAASSPAPPDPTASSPATPDPTAYGWLTPAATSALLRAYGLGRPEDGRSDGGPGGGRPEDEPSTDGRPPVGPSGDDGQEDDAFDLTVTVCQDPLFGPLVSLRVPGHPHRTTALHADRLLPITDVDAAELRIEVLGHHHPDGRSLGAEECAGIDDVVARVGRLVEDIPEVAEMRIDVRASATAIILGSVGVRLGAWEPRPELALRRLR